MKSGSGQTHLIDVAFESVCIHLFDSRISWTWKRIPDLHCVWNPPSPFSGIIGEGSQYAGTKNVAENPTKIDVCGTIVPQCQWHNFDTVTRYYSISIESVSMAEAVLTGNSIDRAEWKSKQKLAYKEHHSRLGAKEDCDEAGDEYESYFDQYYIFLFEVLRSALCFRRRVAKLVTYSRSDQRGIRLRICQ